MGRKQKTHTYVMQYRGHVFVVPMKLLIAHTINCSYDILLLRRSAAARTRIAVNLRVASYTAIGRLLVYVTHSAMSSTMLKNKRCTHLCALSVIRIKWIRICRNPMFTYLLELCLVYGLKIIWNRFLAMKECTAVDIRLWSPGQPANKGLCQCGTTILILDRTKPKKLPIRG